MIAIVDPQASRRRDWWAKATPPLWQYSSRLRRKGSLAERVVDLHEGLPLLRERVLGEDRLDRAFRLAGAAIDALLGVDDGDAPELVDAWWSTLPAGLPSATVS